MIYSCPTLWKLSMASRRVCDDGVNFYGDQISKMLTTASIGQKILEETRKSVQNCPNAMLWEKKDIFLLSKESFLFWILS